MACTVTKVYSPINGAESKLFQDLVIQMDSPRQALEMWLTVQTPAYRKANGDWMHSDYEGKLDENSELPIESLKHFDPNVDEFAIDNISTGMSEILVKADGLKDILLKKIDLFEKRGYTASVEKLNLLKEELGKHTKDEGIIKFVVYAAEELAKAKVRIKKNQAEGDLKGARAAYKYAEAYASVKDLQHILNKTNLIKRLDTAKGTGAGLMGTVLSDLTEIETIYKEFSINKVTKMLTDVSGSVAAEEIREQLRRAPGDIGWFERWCGYLGDSCDAVVALIAKKINQVKGKNREQVEELETKLNILTENLKKTMGGKIEDHIMRLVNIDAGTLISLEESQKLPEELKQYYNELVKIYRELDRYMPEHYKMERGDRFYVPGILLNGMETIYTSKGLLIKGKEIAANAFLSQSTDTDKGQILDENGAVVDSVPMFHTNKIDFKEYNRILENIIKENPDMSESDAKEFAWDMAQKSFAKRLNYNLPETILEFAKSAYNYINMEEVLAELEAARELVKSREYTARSPRWDVVKNRLKGLSPEGSIKTTEGQATLMASAIDDFFKAQVYGQESIDLGTVGSTDVDVNKLLKGISKFTSINMLGLNVIASTTNLIQGEITQFVEVFGREFFDKKAYHKGSKVYAKHLSGVLQDIGEATSSSFLNKLDAQYNILGQYSQKSKVAGMNDSVFRRLLRTSSLFFLQSAGEHALQMRAFMAILETTEAFDKQGNSMGSLLDLHTDGWKSWNADKTGRTFKNLDEVYTKNQAGELVQFDQNARANMSARGQAVLRRMHGNYNPETAAAFQRNAILALVGQMRKWVYPGLLRRWGKKRHNHLLDSDTEGYYITSISFLWAIKKDLVKLKFDVMTDTWKDLTVMERANLRRTIVEAGFVVATGLAATVLYALAKGLDEEEDKAAKYAALYMTYQANRLYSELFFYASPKEAFKIVKSPATSMALMETIGGVLGHLLDGINPFSSMERYAKGDKKGELKLNRELSKLLPIYKQINRLTLYGLDGQIDYFNMNN